MDATQLSSNIIDNEDLIHNEKNENHQNSLDFQIFNPNNEHICTKKTIESCDSQHSFDTCKNIGFITITNNTNKSK